MNEFILTGQIDVDYKLTKYKHQSVQYLIISLSEMFHHHHHQDLAPSHIPLTFSTIPPCCPSLLLSHLDGTPVSAQNFQIYAFCWPTNTGVYMCRSP